MAIALFEPVFDKEKCLKKIGQCLDIGWTGQGYMTEEFEDAWKEYTGFSNALFLNSCTSALILAVDGLKSKYGWHEGDEIITTPNTFVSTNHAILFNGLKAVFADVDDSMCLDPNEIEKQISDRTRGVMFVGIGGNTGYYPQVAKLCKKRGLKLILDASHMAGTLLDGSVPGKEADAVCYSFHAVKNLCTADSGMLCSEDEELIREARKKAWLGIDKSTFERVTGEKCYSWEYDVQYLGGKYHGNSVIAAIALSQLPHLEEGNVRRREIARLYDEAFGGYRKKIQSVTIAPGCSSSYHLYQILTEDRNGLIEHLKNEGIQSGVHYISNTRYSMYSYAEGTCPKAEYISDHVVSLPMHLRLTDDDVRFVAESVIDHIENHKERE